MLVIFAAEIVDDVGQSLPFVISIVSRFYVRLNKSTNIHLFRYHGRPPSAAPATGSIHRYLWEQEEYLSSLFGGKPIEKKGSHPSANDRKQKMDQNNSKLDDQKSGNGVISNEKPTVGKENENFFNF